MTWEELDLGWRESSKMAWEAFCMGSIPIGAAIIDDNGKLIATGRSMQFEKTAEPGEICGHKLSHAETNALLKVNAFEHPRIKSYILYTTMEPCPLCFGACIMAGIRHVKFSALDGVAGSCSLNDKSDFIISKNMGIEGPIGGLGDYHIAVQTYFELFRNQGTERLLSAWSKDNPKAVALGRRLFETKALEKYKNDRVEADVVFKYITGLLNNEINL